MWIGIHIDKCWLLRRVTNSGGEWCRQRSGWWSVRNYLLQRRDLVRRVEIDIGEGMSNRFVENDGKIELRKVNVEEQVVRLRCLLLNSDVQYTRDKKMP